MLIVHIFSVLLYSKEICHISAFKCIEECVEVAKEKQGVVVVDLFSTKITDSMMAQMQKKGGYCCHCFG